MIDLALDPQAGIFGGHTSHTAEFALFARRGIAFIAHTFALEQNLAIWAGRSGIGWVWSFVSVRLWAGVTVRRVGWLLVGAGSSVTISLGYFASAAGPSQAKNQSCDGKKQEGESFDFLHKNILFL